MCIYGQLCACLFGRKYAGQISREIGGEYFLAPIGKTVYDANGIFALNELGRFIWEILPDAEDADDILGRVLETYNVDADTARADIQAFLKKLEALQIL